MAAGNSNQTVLDFLDHDLPVVTKNSWFAKMYLAIQDFSLANDVTDPTLLKVQVNLYFFPSESTQHTKVYIFCSFC